MRTFTTDWSNIFQRPELNIFQRPDLVISLFGTASWLAFIVFAAATFRQFSYRWLRVIAAFFAFLLLPVVVVLIFGRYASYVLSIDWILRLPAILQIAVHSMQLGVAGFIYLQSVRRERGSLVAAA
jgi:hypothetical protein